MAIVLENGVSLPDIPADKLAQYPRAIVLVDDDDTSCSSPRLYLSQTEFAFIDAAILGDSGELVGTMGASEEFNLVGNSWVFNRSYDGTMQIINRPDGSPFAALMWANHDVYEITALDLNTGAYTVGDLYFIDLTTTFPDVMSAPGSFFKGIADFIRKLGRINNKRYTIDEMPAALDSVCWMQNMFREEPDIGNVDPTETLTIDAERIDIYPFKFVTYETSTLNLPNAKYVGMSAFENCYGLNTVNLPVAAELSHMAFQGCLMLENVALPLVQKVGAYCFAKCVQLETASFPNLTNIGQSAFASCALLAKIDLAKAQYIESFVFESCTLLEAVILRESSAVCQLTNSAEAIFRNSGVAKGTGYIYVPSALVDAYKADTKWSYHASQFRAIEDYPDICGTT